MAGEDDEPDDGALFDTLLSERGENWLLEKLKALGLEAKPPKAPGATPEAGSGLAAYLERQLGDLQKDHRSVREKLEAALDMLTPEQRTLLRSQQSESGGGQNSPTKKKPLAPPIEPPPKRRGFLSKL